MRIIKKGCVVSIAGLAVVLMAVSVASLAAADPPGRVNFQGMARDAEGTDLDGPVSMTFRLYDGPVAGTLLWEEIYDATTHPPAVSVSEGLFTVALGDAAHRSAGSEAAFQGVFANHGAVYLGVKVGEDTEMNPRILVVSAPFAVNADALDGLDSTAFAGSVHNHAAADVTSGTLAVGRGGTGLSSPGASGNLLTSNGSGWTSSAPPSAASTGAVVDAANASLNRFGSGTAGDPYELSLNLESPNGWLGAQTFYADTRFPGTGIWTSAGRVGIGTTSPAYSLDVAGAGHFKSDSGWGIKAEGSSGGAYFTNTGSGNNNRASLATTGYGIVAYGSTGGAYFSNTEIGGIVDIGTLDYGIKAMAPLAGGRFEDQDEHGYALVGHGKRGISAYGSDEGGYFKDTDGTSEGYVARTNSGVSCYGAYRGGYFEDMDNSAIAHVAYNDTGIDAVGASKGGHFADTDSGNYADVGYSSYKIFGTGTPSFVQNHPTEKDRVIVYASMEGEEVATYTRGMAKLENGEARVTLGETFRWVTNPDIGLTAHLTPRGRAVPLAVVSLSTTELVVAGPEDVAFDYIVCGLRIGFEESSVVQEKQQESFIPSFRDHRDRYAKYPELRAFNSLERFKAMEAATNGIAPEAMDFSRSRALKETIHEYDPAVDKPVGERLEVADARLSGLSGPGLATSEGAARTDASPPTPHFEEGRSPDTPAVTRMVTSQSATTPVVSSPPYLAASWPVCETVEAGDLLVTAATHPGHLCLSTVPNDPGVVGVVASASDAQPEGPESTSAGILRASVAIAGMIQVKADAAYGPIALNDLLVASPTPGHAMRAQSPAPGTLVGKALEPLETGTGLIRILVMLR